METVLFVLMWTLIVIGIILLTIASLFLLLYIVAQLIKKSKWSEKKKSILPQIVLGLVLRGTRTKLIVEGKENIPEGENIVVVSNHQSNFDILALVPALKNLPIGFVAKKSLAIPWLKQWMEVIGCVFIDRSKPKETMTILMKEAIPKIKNGKPMVLFPEGKRSKSPKMNKMNAGGLIIAKSPKATILPVAVSNTYQIAGNFPWKKTTVYIRIQPPIRFEEYSDGNDYNGFMERLQAQIGKDIEQNGSK